MAKTKRKFYAVRVGRKTGVFNTWDECKEQVNGFYGAKYKSFFTLAEAEAFVRGEDAPKPVIQINPGIVAFVDGSYMVGNYSWGFAVYDNEKLIFTANGKGTSASAAQLRNVAGEVQGAMEAVLWAESQGIKELTIYHDYNGISEWALGKWNTNNEITRNYAAFMKSRIGWVKFQKVAGHTGVEGNELADKLAKAALEE